MQNFVAWFKSHSGFLDDASLDVVDFPSHGRGAIALKDISENHTLFTLPRSLTLSTRTSTLPSILGADTWERFKLGQGWVGLILCMMWEEARGSASKWSEYLESLPTSFDTPMFWGAEDLEELRGTAVVDKIGREDAERDYHEKLLPAIESRPDLFPPDSVAQYYSLERYHIMGSRILSRSFQVERWDRQGDDHDESEANTSAMDVDSAEFPDKGEDAHTEEGEESDDEEVDDPSDVAMVPMADLLNARYGSENAKLFYEETELRMVSTKPIKAGEQIWNTYGDPPNSELLRRYGHVDLVSLPQGGEGNLADIVELRADLVVSVVTGHAPSTGLANTQERIDWWLEEGGDDVFVLETDLAVPETLTSLVRLLLLSDADWKKARDKQKPPRAKLDSQVLSLLLQVLGRRLNEYPTSTEVDEQLLRGGNLTLNKRHAVIVRLGEKTILTGVLEKLREVEQSLLVAEKDKVKRPAASGETGGETRRSKKAKR
ncbi:SET domain-containing protein [Leucogyrophana mollusca]|uniref:SET domain-containing protein n=1 Tax=Leucogyrophana mollusca TaxID=85980 RepID=A0ACB8BEW5_9AGAM|nr:SET domain-containing protein [Leucogyrophana mollusca]